METAVVILSILVFFSLLFIIVSGKGVVININYRYEQPPAPAQEETKEEEAKTDDDQTVVLDEITTAIQEAMGVDMNDR